MLFEDTIWAAVARGGLFSFVTLMWVIILVRIVGLRSFSKMTNFDFVTTIATGSLLASATQVTQLPDLIQALVSLAALFLLQVIVALMRQSSSTIDDLVQNRPTLLIKHGIILRDALRKTRVSEDELVAKLREANVSDLSDVFAAVLETTGDVSVLHGHQDQSELVEGLRKV